MRIEPLSVAILAGGKSRRMGQDKALLEIGGRTLLQHVADRARTVADEVFIVATDRPEYLRFGYPVYPDRYPEAGSLGGIFTAVSIATHEHCLVLACDMPLLNVDLLHYMASQPRDYDVLVPALAAERSDQGDRETLETLHAIYSRATLPAIEARLTTGRYKIIGFFDDVCVRRINEARIRRYDPELRSFVNANTPEDLAEVSRVLTRGATGT